MLSKIQEQLKNGEFHDLPFVEFSFNSDERSIVLRFDEADDANDCYAPLFLIFWGVRMFNMDYFISKEGKPIDELSLINVKEISSDLFVAELVFLVDSNYGAPKMTLHFSSLEVKR